jgi:hypothetical protein
MLYINTYMETLPLASIFHRLKCNLPIVDFKYDRGLYYCELLSTLPCFPNVLILEIYHLVLPDYNILEVPINITSSKVKSQIQKRINNKEFIDSGVLNLPSDENCLDLLYCMLQRLPTRASWNFGDAQARRKINDLVLEFYFSHGREEICVKVTSHIIVKYKCDIILISLETAKELIFHLAAHCETHLDANMKKYFDEPEVEYFTIDNEPFDNSLIWNIPNLFKTSYLVFLGPYMIS